jgi:hypothetical protein
MEKPQAATGWIHLALFVLGPLLAVVVVAYFTASPPPKKYRAAEDPVCLRLLDQRKQVQAQNPRGGSVDLQHIDDQLIAEGCP